MCCLDLYLLSCMLAKFELSYVLLAQTLALVPSLTVPGLTPSLVLKHKVCPQVQKG